MLTLPKSRISRRSGIAGEGFRLRSRELSRFLRRVRASLTVKLVALVGIFVALPIVLYGQFESVDRQTRELVVHSIQHRSWLIAQALRPILDRPEQVSAVSLNSELKKFSEDGTNLQLMVRPSSPQIERNFYYVAAAPRVGVDQLDAQLDTMTQHGILERLSQTCSGDAQQELRYTPPGGREELLTSVVPIQTRFGCWVLISSHTTSDYLSTSIGRPFWQTRQVRVAASIYLIVAALAGLIALSVWQNLRHFRFVARKIRRDRSGKTTFSTRDVLPELASVAQDFDRLVFDLRNVAQDIRSTAEDNAHSFKGPIATIQSSLKPIIRAIPLENERATRALVLIDSSLEKLKALVTAAQRLDQNTADLIESPRVPVNFTRIIADTLICYREILNASNISLIRRLDENVVVFAGAGMLDMVVENIVDNAISFSRPGGPISVTLTRNRTAVDLCIEDNGPGIDPAKIDNIFDRYFSLRPKTQGDQVRVHGKTSPDHAGLGLWIVRRNVEALGGRVNAVNRIGGGLRLHVTIPMIEPSSD